MCLYTAQCFVLKQRGANHVLRDSVYMNQALLATSRLYPYKSCQGLLALRISGEVHASSCSGDFRTGSTCLLPPGQGRGQAAVTPCCSKFSGGETESRWESSRSTQPRLVLTWHQPRKTVACFPKLVDCRGSRRAAKHRPRSDTRACTGLLLAAAHGTGILDLTILGMNIRDGRGWS